MPTGPLDPDEIPQVIHDLTEQNRQMAAKLAPLLEGKRPKYLTPLLEGRGPGAADYPKVCPVCGWGRHDTPELADDSCGMCGGATGDE